MTELKTDHIGMSDDDVQDEIRAMEADKLAYHHIERAIQLLTHAANLSDLRREALAYYVEALKDVQHDYSPNTQEWREAISRARNEREL